MGFFNFLPVPELWEWNYPFPFPFLNSQMSFPRTPVMALLNGMMIFDFIVQSIFIYCQYLHFRPCFHQVTTMRFKHSILFLRPPISPQNPGKTVTTKEKGSSSNLSYGILNHPISQTLPKRSKLLNSGYILQTRSKAFTVHTSASLIFQ